MLRFSLPTAAVVCAFASLLAPCTPALAAPAPDVVTRLRFRLDLSAVPVAERVAAIDRTRQVLAKRLELAKTKGVELVVYGDIVRATVPGAAAEKVAEVERLVTTPGTPSSADALPAPIALQAKDKPVPMLAAPTTVILVRHGEAYGNLPDAAKYKPEQIDSLTEKGIGQAKAAAAAFKGKKIPALIYSPAGRAKQTAEILQEQLHAPAFKETKDLGSLRDGKTPEGKPSTFGWRMGKWKLAEDPTPAGGESLGDAAARAVAAIEEAAAANPGGTIVVVSHSEICAAIIAYAVGTPMWQAYATHHLGNGEQLAMTITKTRAWRCEKK
jgi:broad specificity phosphatase PhoE